MGNFGQAGEGQNIVTKVILKGVVYIRNATRRHANGTDLAAFVQRCNCEPPQLPADSFRQKLLMATGW